MHDLLEHIDAASRAQLYYVSLFAAVTVPDIASALARPNGESNGRAYKQWVRDNLSAWDTETSADSLWRYRCALLHQGRAQLHPDSPIPRLIFLEPSPVQRGWMHMVRMESDAGSALTIDVQVFCVEMTSSARAWLGRNRADPIVKANLAQTIKRHASGLPPYIGGVPVIG